MNARRSVLTALALSLLALAAVAGATAPDGAATARQAQNATNNATPDARFPADRPTVERGEVAAIDVRLNHTSEATVVVGSGAANYELAVDVTDGNGDGTVGLQFDTAAAGDDGSPVAVFRDADSATVGSETSLDGRLDPAGYSLQVYLDGTTGQPADTAVLMVETGATPTTTTTADPTTSDPATETTPATTTEGQPGFGLAAALVGLLAAALLVVRR